VPVSVLEGEGIASATAPRNYFHSKAHSRMLARDHRMGM
jgi:hypothetical protein